MGVEQNQQLCRQCLQEFVDSTPEDKYLTVDLPEDILAAEKVIGIKILRKLIGVVNNKMSTIQFKEPGEVLTHPPRYRLKAPYRKV